MIKDITVSPKQSNQKARSWCIALFVTAIAIFVLTIFIEMYRSVIGVAALIALTAALFIYTKYLSSKYYYDIINDGKTPPLFVVRQLTGKRASTMCRLELHNIESVEIESAEERKAHKAKTGYSVFTYLPTMSPAEVVRITYRSRYEKSEVVIEVSREYLNLLREYVNEAKTLWSEDEY